MYSSISLILGVFFVTIRFTTQQPPNLVGPGDCTDIFSVSKPGQPAPSGKYQLRVGAGARPVTAYCDMVTDGGGWTVIQRRTGPAVNFYRGWAEYERGFGDPATDHWLGNTYLHSLTTTRRYVLRIDLTDWDNKKYYAEYNNFVVGGARCKYKLESIGEFCGDCGDSLRIHVGYKFSTFDQDNDIHSTIHCAQKFHGAWWYTDCHDSNLNGDYKVGGIHSTYADGINWQTGKGDYYSYMKTEMKIRPLNY